MALGKNEIRLVCRVRAMIPVKQGPEPWDFDQRVRQPGLAVLRAAGIAPTAITSRAQLYRACTSGKPEYWRRVRAELRAAFQGCCAYSCFLLEESTTPGGAELSANVDHFKPISKVPVSLAYEWSNLRWAWKTIDHDYKKNKLIALDPCSITICPFSLDVGNFGLLVPVSGLSHAQQDDAEQALEDLGLNRKSCEMARSSWANDFIENATLYGDMLMQRWQPFLWQELKQLGAIP